MQGFKFIGTLEKSYDCAGICSKHLFYMTKSITEGVPTTECLRPMIDDLTKNSSTYGIVAMISGATLLLGFLGSFPLCSKRDEGKEDILEGKQAGEGEMAVQQEHSPDPNRKDKYADPYNDIDEN